MNKNFLSLFLDFNYILNSFIDLLDFQLFLMEYYFNYNYLTLKSEIRIVISYINITSLIIMFYFSCNQLSILLLKIHLRSLYKLNFLLVFLLLEDIS